jgi:putative flippase GtrA
MEPVPPEARFAAAMTAVTRRLPFGLSRVVAPSLLGYLLINLCTFFLDLSLLAAFHGALKWPLPVAVTLSYGSASATSYALNRVLNFRSHAALGAQFPVFVAVSASNYLVFVLGLTNGLAAAGVYYELARIIAALCEGAYLYVMMRWVVFRDIRRPVSSAATETASAAPGATAAPGTTASPATTAASATTASPAAGATGAPAASAPPPAATAPDRR